MPLRIFLFLCLLVPSVCAGGSLLLSVRDSLPRDNDGSCYLPVCHAAVRMSVAFAKVSGSIGRIPPAEVDTFLLAAHSMLYGSPTLTEDAVGGLFGAASALAALRDADVWIDSLKCGNDRDVRAAASAAISLAERFIGAIPPSVERSALERMTYSRRILIILSDVWVSGSEPKGFTSR